MKLIYYHVDAFTGQVFGGNPAGVCPLEAWLPGETLQRMAAEHRHSETAFLVKNPDNSYELRWFTPTIEVNLCGHATLAAAHVLWRHRNETSDVLTFQTRSGPLTVARNEKQLMTLDFPSLPALPSEMPADVEEGLSAKPLSAWKAQKYLFEFRTEEEISKLQPDFARLTAWRLGIIVTAPGREVDFVSRFFCSVGWRSGRPGDRFGPLHAHSLLGKTAGENNFPRTSALGPWRRTFLRIKGRPGEDRRIRDDLSRRRH